jgi:hypothetical protein
LPLVLPVSFQAVPMRTLRPDLLIAVTSKSGLRSDILARASSWMAMSKRDEWIMPVYSAAAVSALRVRFPANMGWFLFGLAGA